MDSSQIKVLAADRLVKIVSNNPPLKGVTCPIAVYADQKEFEAITGESMAIEDHRQICILLSAMLIDISAEPVLIEIRKSEYFSWIKNKQLPNNNSTRGMFVAYKASGSEPQSCAATQIDDLDKYDLRGKIKHAIKREGTNNNQVANELNFAESTLRRYLKGDGDMGSDKVVELLKRFNL